VPAMDGLRLRQVPTDELSRADVTAVRELLLAAFAGDEYGGFEEADWQHALGGTHFVLDLDGEIVAHASVVERPLEIAGVPLRTGYVEAVATRPDHQRRGLGSKVMRAVNAHIASDYELGALGTGSQRFYERLGWQIWQGPSGVRAERGVERTPDEDGFILVLVTPATPPIRLTDPITCDWRPGDVW
jgi:aminoglycoside 2'-N-acetyltransferase I